MKASEFDKLTLLGQVQTYLTECELQVKADNMDPGILSDIGTEGVVFDDYVVYLAKGEYEFDSITGKRKLPGYHVWVEVAIPATRWSPPDGDVVELLTTQRFDEAFKKAVETVIDFRINSFSEQLGDSQAAEADEEYEKLIQGEAP